jgi:hypothetical protein
MHGNRRRWSVWGLLAVSGLGVLLSACGGGTTTGIGPTAALLAPGYLATPG